jgi:hypothetical protein
MRHYELLVVTLPRCLREGSYGQINRTGDFIAPCWPRALIVLVPAIHAMISRSVDKL